MFEANITFRLAKHAGEENVDEIMIALDFVAHYIHFNKKYPLPTEEFESVVETYNSQYDNDIKPKFVYNAAIKANIIRENSEKFVQTTPYLSAPSAINPQFPPAATSGRP